MKSIQTIKEGPVLLKRKYFFIKRFVSIKSDGTFSYYKENDKNVNSIRHFSIKIVFKKETDFENKGL